MLGEAEKGRGQAVGGDEVEVGGQGRQGSGDEVVRISGRDGGT